MDVVRRACCGRRGLLPSTLLGPKAEGVHGTVCMKRFITARAWLFAEGLVFLLFAAGLMAVAAVFLTES
jgi:ABC-type spermidine/putrescine transport system permease subunit I